MKLTKINLSQIVAVGHHQGQLGLLIDRGSEIEYIEVSAPEAAYNGLQQVSNFANNRTLSGCNQDSQTQPLDRCEEEHFFVYTEEYLDIEPVIELESGNQEGNEYSVVDLEVQQPLNDTNPCDQLLSFQVPGYSLSTD